MKNGTLFLLNTTIMPNEGVYVNQKISPLQVWKVLNAHPGASVPIEGGWTIVPKFVSAIGHQGSADVFNLLFPILHNSVQVNRIAAVMKPGDQAICLKVLGRLQEGSILTQEELEKVGYEFYLVTNIGASFNDDGSIINRHLGYLTPVENYVHDAR